MKRALHCGWIDRATWAAECRLPVTTGIAGYSVEVRSAGVCPGWLVRQAEVVDCCAAYTAFQLGQLEVVFPDAEAYLVEGALLLGSIVNEYEAARMKMPQG